MSDVTVGETLSPLPPGVTEELDLESFEVIGPTYSAVLRSLAELLEQGEAHAREHFDDDEWLRLMPEERQPRVVAVAVEVQDLGGADERVVLTVTLAPAGCLLTGARP